MSDWYDNEVFRALLGTISILGGWICFVYCCYKFILCRKKQEERIQTIVVSPSGPVSSNCNKKYSSLV